MRWTGHVLEDPAGKGHAHTMVLPGMQRSKGGPEETAVTLRAGLCRQRRRRRHCPTLILLSSRLPPLQRPPGCALGTYSPKTATAGRHGRPDGGGSKKDSRLPPEARRHHPRAAAKSGEDSPCARQRADWRRREGPAAATCAKEEGGRSGEGDISCQGLYPKSNGRGQRVNPEVVVSCVP